MAVEPRLILGFFDIASGAHWLIILFIGLLLFGRKLPELMKSLGGSIREFKKGMDEGPVQPPTQPPSYTEPTAPHIDGAVSRPADDGTGSPPADAGRPTGAGGQVDPHGHPVDDAHQADPAHHHHVDPVPGPTAPVPTPAPPTQNDSAPPDPHQHH